MKFYESSFEEYLHSNQEYNIHPELDKIYKKFPMNIHELENIIIFSFALPIIFNTFSFFSITFFSIT